MNVLNPSDGLDETQSSAKAVKTNYLQAARMGLKWLSPPVKSELVRVIIVPMFFFFCFSLFVGCQLLFGLRTLGYMLIGSSDPRTTPFDSPLYKAAGRVAMTPRTARNKAKQS